MKKSDIAMIILIATVGVIGAFFGTRAVLNDTATEEISVPTIERISPELAPVDDAIFNPDALNPTVEIEIVAPEAAQ